MIANIGLDFALIYGVKGIIPSLGCRGAAIATNLSEFLQIMILTSIFLSRKNIEKFKILKHCELNLKLFQGCCRIGLPMSLGHFVTLFAWYIIQTVVSHSSVDASTAYNVAMNLNMFFFFIAGSSGRSASAICSNMIGREDLESVRETYKFFVKMSVGVGVFLAIPLILFPEEIINALSMLPDDISHLYPQIKTALGLVFIVITLETLFQSTFGVLLAGGDVIFGIVADIACLWLIVAAPAVCLYFLNMLDSVVIVFACMVLKAATASACVYSRYKSMKWYKKLV